MTAENNKPMKTIRQIADEIGVSKQAVYKRVKGSLHVDIAPYVHTVGGLVCVSYEGEKLIIAAFSENASSKDAHTPHTEAHTNTDGAHTPHTTPHTYAHTAHTSTDEAYAEDSQATPLQEQSASQDALLHQLDLLSKQNETLFKQLENERAHSREQADKLADLAFKLAELTHNSQVLQGAEQSRANPALLTSSDNVAEDGAGRNNEKGFIARLFGK